MVCYTRKQSCIQQETTISAIESVADSASAEAAVLSSTKHQEMQSKESSSKVELWRKVERMGLWLDVSLVVWSISMVVSLVVWSISMLCASASDLNGRG